MSAKAQRIKGRGKSSKRPFLMLYRNVKRSTAYHGLSCGARAALIELIDKHQAATTA